MQSEYMEFLQRMEKQDSVPLALEADDEYHKQYKWTLMNAATFKLFDGDGFTEEEWERRFRTHVETRKN